MGGAPGDELGRRPVLMIGLLALPLRGLLYGVSNDPVWLLLGRRWMASVRESSACCG
ncbi:hypothetical protein [Salinicola tamaricis]|uniref:hypothetical protein n=1 Tax=Salinicola tamaricis TaxID=1771309 RepID=UPI0013EC5F38|nr:hypothetical protein [Salinicola tamaricis]